MKCRKSFVAAAVAGAGTVLLLCGGCGGAVQGDVTVIDGGDRSRDSATGDGTNLDSFEALQTPDGTGNARHSG